MGNSFELKPGDLVVYHGEELGKVKSVDPVTETALVWYHSGETAARTRWEDLSLLINAYVVDETSLGGDAAKELEPAAGEEDN